MMSLLGAEQAASRPSWAGSLPGWPPFLRELAGTLATCSQYVLYGNIRDLYLIPAQGPAGPPPPSRPPHDEPPAPAFTGLRLADALWGALQPSGYQCLIQYDLVHGIGTYPSGPVAESAAGQLVGNDVIGTAPPLASVRRCLAAVAGAAPPLVSDRGAQQVRTAGPEQDRSARSAPGWIGQRDRPRVAFVIDYASRIVRSPGNLDPEERDFFLFCLKLAHDAIRTSGGPPERPGSLYNPIIWLVEGERDVPAWLTAGGDQIRTIGIPYPGLDERTTMARIQARNFGVVEPTGDQHRLIGEFATQAEGMTLQSMREVTRLALERQLPFAAIADALRIYKLGVEENPWRRSHIRRRISSGEKQIMAAAEPANPGGRQPDQGQARLTTRVFGQARAVEKTFDILKRAALGLSGAQAANPGTRPRGVIFFAGPTGVGKTELAKATAELLFGQRDSFLRFDMSEFAAEHSDHRLIGAPPGYVGFESGGELTSAVRTQPFRVILFDEIDKAHRRVLDKFLQILEDGRLTDGQGITTYFSECILIFTSNLGIMATDESQPDKKIPIVYRGEEDYPSLERKVRAAIARHFTTEMGRPELLNRFGDNIVVFDFISDDAAWQIFDLQISNVSGRVAQEQQLHLEFSDAAYASLREICTTNLDNGGRGIGNMLEPALINPLARTLFDHELPPGSKVMVTSAEVVDGAYTLTIRSDGVRAGS